MDRRYRTQVTHWEKTQVAVEGIPFPITRWAKVLVPSTTTPAITSTTAAGAATAVPERAAPSPSSAAQPPPPPLSPVAAATAKTQTAAGAVAVAPQDMDDEQFMATHNALVHQEEAVMDVPESGDSM